MKHYLRSLLYILLIACSQLAIVFVLEAYDKTASLVHKDAPLIIAFLAGISLIIALFNIMAMKLDAKDQGNIFLGTVTFRLIMSILFVFVLLYLGLDHRLTFILNFFVLYLCYLVFEITTFIANLRAISSKAHK